MSAARRTEQKLFGLFELDAAGTVLYARIEPDGKPVGGGTGPDVSGRNFYEDVAPFENVEEFRRRVLQFARGIRHADNFSFNCQYQDGALPVRVLLARIRERTSNDQTKSVLVHIRHDAKFSAGKS
jgi:hypothetical protein